MAVCKLKYKKKKVFFLYSTEKCMMEVNNLCPLRIIFKEMVLCYEINDIFTITSTQHCMIINCLLLENAREKKIIMKSYGNII